MTYNLIAFDMDGTLLTSQQTISETSVSAIEQAIQKGKKVVFATGRSLSELKTYRQILPSIQYAILASGGLIYDLEKEEVLLQNSLPVEVIDQILDILKVTDVMPSVMVNGQGYLQKSHFNKIQNYHVTQYRDLYEDTAEFVDNLSLFIEEHKQNIEKINLYHTSPEERDQSYKVLSSQNALFIKAEYSGVEITSLGADKGSGLDQLAKILGTSLEQMIAVGDADNDETMIKKAGLGIAMGNANDKIKQLADVIVSDNDHNGCQEAIEHYLLK